jgi:pimeloyl-ACP methyl ester carboxylesterase
MKSTLLCLAATALLACMPALAEDATGQWSGTIAGELKVFLEFQHSADGRWDGTLRVPQQNLTTKVDKLVVSDSQVSFALSSLNAAYTSSWNAQDKAWQGTWSQGGQTVPLALQRSDAVALKPKRPQEEAIATRAPAYTSSEVSFANDAAKVTLAGTFTAPPGKGPFPAVVLVHGSGPHERDETVFDHKIFLVMADHLTRQGIAVLRYDKRGNGKSTGLYKDATSFDFASDAEAAVRYLRSRKDVAPRHIGIVGHSEGGMIAPLVASRDPALGFVVLLAGPGVRGELLMVEQIELAAKAKGIPAAELAKRRALNQSLFAAIASAPDPAAARAKVSQFVAQGKRTGDLPESTSEAAFMQFANPWFHAFFRHDPAPALQATRQPILVLNGELDLQVPAAMDLAAIRTALQDNPRAVVKELPKLNHLFQTATTGAGSEYYSIEETMSPLALETVSSWIRATVR